MICALCGAVMAEDALPSTFRCDSCHFFASKFHVRINDLKTVNEVVRVEGLKPLRQANFSQLLDACKSVIPANASVLDVGCGHGWFIEAALQRGYSCVGVEPDKNIADIAHGSGAEIYNGYFPEVLPETAKFDVVIFNDVFEHIPNPEDLPTKIAKHLVLGGLLIVNIPMSDGLIFRVSRLAARIGFQGPLARMWQRGLPSPHVSYFSHENLPALLTSKGFDIVKAEDLESLATNRHSPSGLPLDFKIA